jgi:hypothetical protein
MKRKTTTTNKAVRVKGPNLVEVPPDIRVEAGTNAIAHVKEGTVPTSVPKGMALVHNRVLHSTRTRCGTRGFRAWVQKSSADLKPCGCGWAGLPHYRIPT